MGSGRTGRRRAPVLVVLGAVGAATLAPGAPAPADQRCRRGEHEVVRHGDTYDFHTFMTPDPRPAGVPMVVVRVIEEHRLLVETLGEPRDVRITARWASSMNDYYLEVDSRSGHHESDRGQLLGGAEASETVELKAVRNCDPVIVYVGNRVGDPSIRAEITFEFL